jgi:hypothetical protein
MRKKVKYDIVVDGDLAIIVVFILFVVFAMALAYL